MKAIRVIKYKGTEWTGGTYYQKGNRLIRWYSYRRFDEALKLALESTKINNKTQIVGDFGCGWGYFLLSLSKSFRSAVALDYIQSKIESGRRWNMIRELVNTELGDVENLHYINGDIQRLPFNDDVFDVLFVMSVLEHVSDAKKAIAELHRVIVEGGFLSLALHVRLEWRIKSENLLQ